MSPNKRMILSKIIERTNIEIAEKVGEEVFLRCIESYPLGAIVECGNTVPRYMHRLGRAI